MLWLIFGLLSALFFALLHITSKYAVERADPYYLSNAIWITYSALSLPLVLLFHQKIVMNKETVLGFIGIGLLIFSTNILYLKSLKYGDISKTVPLLSITPIFTLGIAMLWLREFPKMSGILGIILIIAGTYFINFEHFRGDRVFAPFHQLFKNRASRLMLLVAAAYGLGSVTDKFIINHSNILTRIALFSYFALVFNTVYLAARDRRLFIAKTKDSFRLWKTVLLLDVFYFLTLYFQMTGLSLTYTSYVIALKRTSAVFSVILAYFIFNERRHFRAALAATVLMMAGVFLMAFF